jgi:hypothetical protein
MDAPGIDILNLWQQIEELARETTVRPVVVEFRNSESFCVCAPSIIPHLVHCPETVEQLPSMSLTAFLFWNDRSQRYIAHAERRFRRHTSFKYA